MIDGLYNVLGIHGFAVVKFDALAQLEGPF